jgi:hypothetical protein
MASIRRARFVSGPPGDGSAAISDESVWGRREDRSGMSPMLTAFGQPRRASSTEAVDLAIRQQIPRGEYPQDR